MRRVPEFLPEVIAWRNPINMNRTLLAGAVDPKIDIFACPEPHPTRMDLIVYESTAIVNGLLMTEVSEYGKIVRSFFGYRCGQCREVFLIRKNVRCFFDIDRDLYHDCDPSNLRQAVRNARDLGRERDEYIMEGPNGEWHPERRFYSVRRQHGWTK